MAGNENCLACHAVDGAIEPAPFTHSAFTIDTCQMCHQLASEFADTAAPAKPTATADPPTVPTATAAPSTVAPTTTVPITETSDVTTSDVTTPDATTSDATTSDATTPTAPETSATSEDIVEGTIIDALAITSHPIEGNESCLNCHGVTSNVAPAPATHAGLTADTCQQCHIAGADAATTTPVTTAPITTTPITATQAITASDVTTSAAPETSATDVVPVEGTIIEALAITSHPVEGNESCLNCHGVTSTVAPAPATHAGLTVATCQRCHVAGTDSREQQ
jgi:hypothetical protein